MNQPEFAPPTRLSQIHAPLQTTASIGAGFMAAIRGLRFAVRTPELRRVYVQMMLVLYLLTVVLAGGLITALWLMVSIPIDAAWWLSLGIWLLRILGSLASLLIAPLLALWIINIVFPSLAERVFFTGLQVLAPEMARELEAKTGLSMTASVGVSLRRFMHFLGFTCIIFVFSGVPVVGTLLAPILQAWLTARALSWEFFDPLFDKQGLSYAEQKAYVDQHRQTLVGFGLANGLMLAIPFVGPLCFALAQASAAFLWVEKLEPRVLRAE